MSEHIADISSVRAKTKAARFKPLPDGVESIAAVVAEALAYLESHLAAGFKAHRSQQSLTRRGSELTQSIQLRLGSGNLSGVSVEVSAYAAVRSSKFKSWCSSEGTGYARDLLWSRQVGYLGGANDYIKWQLGDKLHRAAELNDLCLTLQTTALPSLDAWATKEAIATAVFRRTELDRIDWLMEAALWSGATATAERLLGEHLLANPQQVADCALELARFRSSGGATPLPSAISGAAYLAVRYGLSLPQ
ncbi:hypothetical protein [Ramlibacter sp. WS9]|uniref:hypothetical protein n=1 Tax=Ramlibacter sp. WS9 TaxID=1882741 RepID=UPI001141B0FF|nr:hypothetical protein [Ramlibacter sp. WS9]ROZ78873.1 hypothetical protein EEB15_04075 [Ramlibacter sp. WS9]